MSIIKEIRVPDIGDFSNVPVIELPVTVGDHFEEGDTLLVLESDKSTLDVPADEAGKVVNIALGVDDLVSEGSLIMTVEVESSSDRASENSPDAQANTAVASIGAASATPQQASQSEYNADPVQPAATATPVDKPAVKVAAPATADKHKSEVIYASPSVRRYARQLGAPIREIEGSGSKHRITREDIEQYVKRRLTGAEDTASQNLYALQGLPDWPQIDHEKFGPVERAPLSRISKISGPALTRNAMLIPHVTHFDKADITELEAFRQNLNSEARSDDAKITLLTFAVKAVVAALKTYPAFNSSLDGEELVFTQYWNIGIAADTPDGLLVPVIKQADSKGFRSIANEMARLAASARKGKLAAADMQGATFTISSLGGVGGTNFTPIINAPEVAILGLPRSEIQPVWNGETFEPRQIQPLSLSFDHRVIDGVAAARFLSHVAVSLNDLRRINL